MIPRSDLLATGLAALACAVLPVIAWLQARRRLDLRVRNLAAGALFFLLFSQVLEKALHAYVLTVNPSSSALLKAASLLFALYGALAAAVFEESGRWLGLRHAIRPRALRDSMVAFAIGWAGAEAVLVGTALQVQSIVLAVALDRGELADLLGPDAPSEAVGQVTAALSGVSVAGAAVAVLERLCAFVLQLALTVLMWRLAMRGPTIRAVLAAMLVHAAMDLPAGLYQARMMPLWAAEACFAAMAAVAAGWTVRRVSTASLACRVAPLPERSR